MNGFISLHRRIIEWEWYTEPDTFRVFIHLLMMANYAPAKVRGVNVARGQHITSTVKLVEMLNMSFSKVRKALKRLREGGEIILENPSNRFSLVTIVKYDAYQISPEELVKQNASKTDAEDIQTSPNNKDNNNNKENNEINIVDIINVHDWKTIYLQDQKLIKEFCRHHNLDIKIFQEELDSFVIHRMNSSTTTDKGTEFSRHFRNFIRKRIDMKTKDGKVKSNYSKQAF